MPSAQEAAAAYRELMGTNPDRYRPRLASILDNLGVYLDSQRRYADALAATKEAVSLYWQLTKTSPGQYRADRARPSTTSASDTAGKASLLKR